MAAFEGGEQGSPNIVRCRVAQPWSEASRPNRVGVEDRAEEGVEIRRRRQGDAYSTTDHG